MSSPVDRFSDFFKGVEGGGPGRSAEQDRRLHTSQLETDAQGFSDQRSWFVPERFEAHTPSNVVKNLLERIQPLFDRDPLAILRERWDEVAGPVAAHCHPLRIQRNTLWIHVNGSAWNYEITLFHKKSILQNVQTQFPRLKVKDLNLRTG